MEQFFQHAAMTDGITVRVAVNFLPEQSRIEAGKWFWVYHIRIENHSESAVQLLSRSWKITDGRGVDHVMEELRRITQPGGILVVSFSGRKPFAALEKQWLAADADPDGKTAERFEIVHLSGWAPSPDQPKPARRGSGVSLTQILPEPKNRI